MNKFILFLIIPFLILASCKNQQNESDFSKEFAVPDSVLHEGELEISQQAMDEIVQNVSSPVEMAALIKSLGVPFSKNHLATTDYVDSYNTNYQKALGLGIFGADLGYLNMYNKTSTVIDYITAIKTLADGLRVGQFFDFTTLKRLATNNENLDSLMYISVQNFNRMDQYLRESNRSNLSSLIIAGIWIESMYLVGEVTRQNPSPELVEKIGEQKIILANLMLILKNYEQDPKFKDLVDDFRDIQALYKDVTITYEKGEPVAVEEDGMLVIQQNDKSIVDISDEQVFMIIDKTAEVRNNIINR